MKKILIILAIIIVVLINRESDTIVIPNDSIRFRIISNSNTVDDLDVKSKLSINLTKFINDMLSTSKNKSDAVKILNENKHEIETYVDNFLVINNKFYDYNISIGSNYFPKKEYKGVKYKEGYYDSLVVTLGESKGVNFWCCVYPPLCNINEDNPKYTTLVSEILNK